MAQRRASPARLRRRIPRSVSASAVPSSPAAASVAAQPAAVQASQQTFRPALTIVATSVQPAEARPGEAIKLLIQYEVSGLPPGFSYEVAERRELLLNDTAIGQVEETVSRGVGGFTSSKTISVPPNASPGFYSFKAKVTLAGVDAEASSFFRVRP